MLATLALALLAAHIPLVLGGWDRLQRDLGDTRLNNYFLEHAFLWLRRDPSHLSLWDAPFFYPTRNVSAFSDIMLGFLPLYAPWRLMGLDPMRSMQLWMFCVSCLNVLGIWYLMRRGLRQSPWVAFLATFVFGFSAARVNQIGHQQLWPLFYVAIFMCALSVITRAWWHGTAAPRRSFALCGLAFVIQFYSAFYFTWYLVLLIIVLAMSIPFLGPAVRKGIGAGLRTDWRALTTTGILAAIAIFPGAQHYLDAAEMGGYRSFSQVTGYLLSLKEWFYVGPDHVLYGPWAAATSFNNPTFEIELRAGIGYVTVALGLLGLWRTRSDVTMRTLTLAGGILFFFLTVWQFGFKPWSVIYTIIPGARAIRSMGRFSIFVTLPLAIGAATLVQYMWSKAGHWRLAALLLTAMVIAEQLVITPSMSIEDLRSRQLNLLARTPNRTSGKCDAFGHLPILGYSERGQGDYTNIDAMWLSLAIGIPTINGYSGKTPPGYPLLDPTSVDSAARESLVRKTESWLKTTDSPQSRICWL